MSMSQAQQTGFTRPRTKSYAEIPPARERGGSSGAGWRLRSRHRPAQLGALRRRWIPTTSQSAYRGQRGVNSRRNQFLARCPLERAADAFDLLVDSPATPAACNHPRPHGLDPERPEVCRERVTVHFANEPTYNHDVLRLPGRCAVRAAVVLLGVTQVARNNSFTVASAGEPSTAAGLVITSILTARIRPLTPRSRSGRAVAVHDAGRGSVHTARARPDWR